MGTHVKNERVRLLRRMEQLLNKLEEKDPDTVKEFRAARAALDVYGAPSDSRYARIRSTKEAIRAALEYEGDWQNKRELAHKLMEGGVQVDPEFGLKLIVESNEQEHPTRPFRGG
jgi:hypothetical protein